MVMEEEDDLAVKMSLEVEERWTVLAANDAPAKRG
jgi:hypothetical protein